MIKKFGIPLELEQLLTAEDIHSPIWIVGGVIRDHLAGRKAHDFDFATAADAVALARRAADRLNADVYILDQERGAARVLHRNPTGRRLTFDFARIRGDSIEDDLLARDFSINALALRLNEPDTLIDPCGGLQHLRDGLVEACSADAIESDPIRSLRAIRIATDFMYALSPQVIQSIRHTPSFASISRERVRDEIFKIFALGKPASALQLLAELGLLPELFESSHSQRLSENTYLSDQQALTRSIRSVKMLRTMFDLLSSSVNLDIAAQATLGLLTWSLGRFRTDVEAYLEREISYERSCASMALFVTFLHPLIFPMIPTAHDEASANALPFDDSLYPDLLESFRLSREEITFVKRWLAGLEVLQNAVAPDIPEELFSHRFYRKSAGSGLAAVLSSLAFDLTITVQPPAAEVWTGRIERARSLFEAWFEKHERVVNPEPVINGEEAMRVAGLEPGPRVGELLRVLLEQQVAGEIRTRAQALDFIQERFGTSGKRPAE